MKKIIILFIFFIGCTDQKTKIAEREKEILKEKSLIDRKLEATKDSALPTPEQQHEWDSLYTAEDRLNTEYDSLQKELKKY
ncbi:MAG: hypothetical protein JO072_05430 [Parafilimonas sp.]|nr:hypothetical protein [Parafilimonas sp.]